MQVFNPNDPNVAMLEQVARSLGPELCRTQAPMRPCADGGWMVWRST